MSLHTRAQFAELTGKTRAHISTYIKRGKIILSGKYIDDSIPQNKEIMNRWIKQSAKKGIKGIKEPKIKTSPPKGIEEPQIQPDQFEGGLDAVKKQAEIDLKHAQIEKTKLQNQKLRGEAIPTDMVKNVVSVLGHSFQSSYKNGAEALILDFCHKMKASAKIEAEMKGKLINLINKSHENSITEAKKSIETIVDENAVVKNSDEDE